MYDADFPPKSEIHKLKLKELKSKLAAQQHLMAKPRSHSNNAAMSPPRSCRSPKNFMLLVIRVIRVL
jgi:hypothetical protein